MPTARPFRRRSSTRIISTTRPTPKTASPGRIKPAPCRGAGPTTVGPASPTRNPARNPVEQAEPLLQMTGIGKTFPGVRALQDASLQVGRAEVHALIGENGAGKSTLIKILTGAYRRDTGTILFDG